MELNLYPMILDTRLKPQGELKRSFSIYICKGIHWTFRTEMKCANSLFGVYFSCLLVKDYSQHLIFKPTCICLFNWKLSPNTLHLLLERAFLNGPGKGDKIGQKNSFCEKTSLNLQSWLSVAYWGHRWL
jgi:hypothetical protein